MLTASKFLEQWSEIHGVTARVEETKPEDLISMLPRGLGKELVESSVWVAEYGWGGGAPDVLMPKDVSFSLPPVLCSVLSTTAGLSSRS